MAIVLESLSPRGERRCGAHWTGTRQSSLHRTARHRTRRVASSTQRYSAVVPACSLAFFVAGSGERSSGAVRRTSRSLSCRGWWGIARNDSINGAASRLARPRRCSITMSKRRSGHGDKCRRLSSKSGGRGHTGARGGRAPWCPTSIQSHQPVDHCARWPGS